MFWRAESYSAKDQARSVRLVAISLGDLAMLWIVLFVATVATLTLAFVPDLSI
jgi:hypothetical protein